METCEKCGTRRLVVGDGIPQNEHTAERPEDIIYLPIKQGAAMVKPPDLDEPCAECKAWLADHE